MQIFVELTRHGVYYITITIISAEVLHITIITITEESILITITITLVLRLSITINITLYQVIFTITITYYYYPMSGSLPTVHTQNKEKEGNIYNKK